MLWTAAGVCGLGGLYALRLEEHWLRIERHPMPLPGLGADLEGAKLVHISDPHCSPIVVERYLRECVHRINELEPDFVAVTGDFITGPKHYARRVARVLGDLRPRVATVACLGNHDYGVFHPTGIGGIRGLSQYLAEQLGHADIFVMMNESRVFSLGESTLQFVGVEDYWTRYYNPRLAFEMAVPDLPTIGLVHNPDAAMAMARYGAHYMLSGHTHGSSYGQMPLGDAVLPTANKHFVCGHYALGGDRHLYVNRGLGYGRRINLNARPEVTLFTLRRAEEQMTVDE